MIGQDLRRDAETVKREEQKTDSQGQQADSATQTLNLKFLVGLAIAAIVVGAVMVIASDSIEIGDFFDQLSKMNRRALSLAVLPFIVALVVLGGYLRKKKEERMWKDALMQTRAKRQAQIEAAARAAEEKEK